MAEDPDTSGLPTISGAHDPVSGLLRAGLLMPPARPGVAASLDRYEVLRFIGSGGMGVVLLGREIGAQKDVAIKMIKPDLLYDRDAVHRFLVEARHMTNLSHPHILKVLDIVDRPEGPYFALPYMARGSLARLARPGEPLDPALAARVALQIAEALGYAHRKGIIHRDLKPDNVLLDGEGVAYLADFGLVRTVFNDSFLDVQQSHCEGTVPYMSPGVAAGEAEDTRCDIYSFGATFYHMLVGRPPYEGDSSLAVLQKIIAGPPLPVRRVNPKAPESLARIAEGAMARELRDRYASMDDVAEDLRRAERGEKPRGPYGGRGVRFRLRSKRVFVALAVAGALALLAVVARFVRFSIPPVESLVLFADDFSDGKLAPDRWRHGTFKNEFPARRYSRIAEGPREIVLSARVEHIDGWTALDGVWLDSLVDFKKYDDVLVEVDLSGWAANGFAGVMIADGAPPRFQKDTSSARVFWVRGGSHSPADLPRRRIRIDLNRDSGAATVKMDSPEEDFRFFDISSLPEWRLRFQVSANSSTGFDLGAAELKLFRVRARRIRRSATLIGQVVDSANGRPLEGVLIRTRHDDARSRSNAHGMFRLYPAPGGLEISSELAGFEPVIDPLRVDLAPNRQVRLHVAMRKTRPVVGDVVASVPLPHHNVYTMDVTRTHIVVAAGEGDEVHFFRMGLDGKDATRIPMTPRSAAKGLAYFGGQLYGLECWPGRLYRIDTEGRGELVRRLDIDWPQEMAFDGRDLWYLETDHIGNRFAVHAMELESGEKVGRFESGDPKISGLAWGEGRLWVSSLSGFVYEVDVEKALEGGKLDAGVVRKIRGRYDAVSFSEGYLWGLDNEAERICKILVADEPAPSPLPAQSSADTPPEAPNADP